MPGITGRPRPKLACAQHAGAASCPCMPSQTKVNLPSAPVTLSVQQITELCQHLSELRHDINNDLSKIVGTAELIKLELGRIAPEAGKPTPKSLERIPLLLEQPKNIARKIEDFSRELEGALGIGRP